MSITVGSIMESIAQDIDQTYRRLKKQGLELEIPQVDVTLSLQVELDGQEETNKGPVLGKLPDRPWNRFVMDESLLAKKGLSFRRIATLSGTSSASNQEQPKNLEIHFTFLPQEDNS